MTYTMSIVDPTTHLVNSSTYEMNLLLASPNAIKVVLLLHSNDLQLCGEFPFALPGGG